MPDFIFLKTLFWTYLLGSIPFGWIAGKFYGIDVRNAGSGNIGFTNVWRLVGAFPAAIVLFLDVSKGYLAPLYGYSLGGEKYAMAGVIGVLTGHLFPIFLKFKGGKGVASGMGFCLYINPLMTLLAILIFLVVVKLTRYVSAGSIAASLAIIILSLAFNLNFYYKLVLIPAGLGVIYMHRDNIKRILNGNENKIGKKEV